MTDLIRHKGACRALPGFLKKRKSDPLKATSFRHIQLPNNPIGQNSCHHQIVQGSLASLYPRRGPSLAPRTTITTPGRTTVQAGH